MKEAWYKNHLLHNSISVTFNDRPREQTTLEGRIPTTLGREEYTGCIVETLRSARNIQLLALCASYGEWLVYKNLLSFTVMIDNFFVRILYFLQEFKKN